MSWTFDNEVGGWIDTSTGAYSPVDPTQSAQPMNQWIASNNGAYYNPATGQYSVGEGYDAHNGAGAFAAQQALHPDWTDQDFQNAWLSGMQEVERQDAANVNKGRLPLYLAAAAITGGALGALGGAGAAGAEGFGEGALGSWDAVGGLTEAEQAALGGGTLMPPAIAPATNAGYTASPFVGSEGAAGTLYDLSNIDQVVNAGMAGAGFAPSAALEAGSGFPSLPSVPPGESTAAQQLAKALLGDSSTTGDAASRGIQGFLQGATPTTQGYVRKARPPLTQPAFLGDQGQQALGSAEDTAFNQMVSDRGDDVSTRARQMASQLRGRPGMFGFRSG